MNTTARFSLLCLSITLSSLARSTSYYVDSVDGHDGGTGTTIATAWRTLAKVNASLFRPGDFVLFKRGGVWREGPLKPSVSGNEGNPVTFAAYGSGAKPVINGADTVYTWSIDSERRYKAAVTWTPNQVIRGGKRMVKDRVPPIVDNHWFWSSNTLYICCGHPDSLAIEASHRNECIVADNRDYLAFYDLDLRYSNGSSGAFRIKNDRRNLSNITLGNVETYYNYGRGIFFYDDSEHVFTNVLLTNVISDHNAAARGAAAGIELGYGQPMTTGGGLINVTVIGGRISYSGIYGHAGEDVSAYGMNLSRVNGISITNMEFDHNSSGGLLVNYNSSNVTVTGGSVHENGRLADRVGIGIGGYGTANITNLVFDSIDLHDSYGDGIEFARSNEVPPEYVTARAIVRYCRIRNSEFHGVKIGGHHTGIVFEYNEIYSNGFQGVILNPGVGDTAIPASNGGPEVSFYGNAIWANGTKGGSNSANITTSSNSTAGAVSLKNNIIGLAKGNEIEVPMSDPTNLTSDYNDWYHPATGSYMEYHGASYDLAEWQNNTAQDGHSLGADPQFVSSSLDSASAFKLRPTSSMIDAGTNLGIAYENGLDSQAARFPYTTANQNLFGKSWEIGPFVFPQSELDRTKTSRP
jgi:hypothetical protein